MSQTHYRGQRPAFGKLQGTGVAAPRQHNPVQPYSAPPETTQHIAQYDEIIGSGFSGYANQSGGGLTNLQPVKGRRFVSGIIDLIIVSFLGGIILTLQHGIGAGIVDLLDGGLLNFYIWFGTICFIYGFGMEASPAQGTIGKLATGTVVVNEDGQRMTFAQALGRNLGKFITYVVPLYIGYLMVLWSQKNQSLHDKMAGTIVCQKR